MHAAVEKDSGMRLDTTSCQSPATSFERILPMEPDMVQLCVSTCTTKHTKCSRKPRGNNTKLFWKGGMTMINTANLCLIVGGMKKV